jgi:GT2 family glycosyltransferase
MELSIIIVNYNSFNYLEGCLKSISEKIKVIEYEVIIVDNNSTEVSLSQWAKENRTDYIKVILLDENIGFAAANNLAVQEAKSGVLLFMNPDVFLIEDCISPILDFMKTLPAAGACAPKLLYEDLSFQNSTGFRMGILYETAEAFMLIGLIRRLTNRRLIDSEIPVKVGWLSGAFLLVKKEVFQVTGGFDPSFFLNYEDIDFCERILNNGYDNFYFPFLKCVHLDHKSFAENYDKLVYTRYKSRLVYTAKHYGIMKRIIVKIIHIIGLILRILTANIIYSKNERKLRYKGYLRSLRLYMSFTN